MEGTLRFSLKSLCFTKSEAPQGESDFFESCTVGLNV